MFEPLTPPPPDKILSLMQIFRDDPRNDKLDLGIGVYRDTSGATPILPSVREAERRLYGTEQTKSYVGPAGDPAFVKAVGAIVFGDSAPFDRIRGVQTPGAAGALRVLAGLIARAKPGATVWVSDPTWINHQSILEDAGLVVRAYRYFDPATCRVDFESMERAFRAMPEGDVVLLHGCCHNPTGADLDEGQWRALAEIIAARSLFPFVDFAYQGFGDGLEADAFAVRHLLSRVPEMAVAVSCSKNFGIYRERTGAAFVMGVAPRAVDVALSNLVLCARVAYSMPPDHGASIVRIVLDDPALASAWRSELEAMRSHVVRLRETLADEFRRQTNGMRYEFLRAHKGMFSLIGATAAEAERLRSEYGVYIVSDGRINLAGLQESAIERFVAAVMAVTASR